ncbi:glycyl-radical enzyme activating protein [Coprothermobacter proteolyticus]|uniref:glycyl-radical enzyme activating protein n=1 Tax=Coprothermobacter proteolyticus TaxID=35786 RepID=UPI000D2F7794|nr:glycyl-radical enzyme activating protein [Coprothermobacter proteolyticus]
MPQKESVVDWNAQGTVFDVQRFAVHDGPGIRTLVFLKGCPLSCWWCQNPEGISPIPELMHFEFRCMRCGTCQEVCPQHALELTQGGVVIDRTQCTRCGVCAHYCPTTAWQMVGFTLSVKELMQELEKDRLYYDQSGGGVTFTGGEPFMQAHFLQHALKACKELRIHTAVETSGFVPKDIFSQLAPLIDVFLYDQKLADSQQHAYFTGVPNELIKENLKALAGSGRASDVIIRIPLIPGITDAHRNIEGLISFLKNDIGSVRRVDLLPFHDVGEKYVRLGKPYRMPTHESPDADHVEHIKALFENSGFTVKVGG